MQASRVSGDRTAMQASRDRIAGGRRRAVIVAVIIAAVATAVVAHEGKQLVLLKTNIKNPLLPDTGEQRVLVFRANENLRLKKDPLRSMEHGLRF
jgi:hypothetical protein